MPTGGVKGVVATAQRGGSGACVKVREEKSYTQRSEIAERERSGVRHEGRAAELCTLLLAIASASARRSVWDGMRGWHGGESMEIEAVREA